MTDTDNLMLLSKDERATTPAEEHDQIKTISVTDLGTQLDLNNVTMNVYFDARDSVGGNVVSTTEETLNIDDVLINTGEFSLSSDEITFNRTGLYVIHARASYIKGTAPTFGVAGHIYIELNTGSGFSKVTGSDGWGRAADNGRVGAANSTLILNITSGDIIRIRIRCTFSTNTIVTEADASGITIHNLT